MPGQYWVAPAPPFHIADGTAVTAAATLTELTPTPRIMLPSPWLNEFPGKRLEFQAAGHYTTNATATTATFGLYIGAVGTAVGSMTAVATTAAITLVPSVTNRFWRMEGNFQIRTLAAAGTCIGVCEFSNVSSGGTDLMGTAAGSTATINTTIANEFILGVNVSVAQSITCRYFGIRMVN
jgi:hypothetical protein